MCYMSYLSTEELRFYSQSILSFQDVNTFKLLGKNLDNAPGEIIDKIARKLKLHMLSTELRDISGGRAIETVGKDGDPFGFEFNIALRHRR